MPRIGTSSAPPFLKVLAAIAVIVLIIWFVKKQSAPEPTAADIKADLAAQTFG